MNNQPDGRPTFSSFDHGNSIYEIYVQQKQCRRRAGRPCIGEIGGIIGVGLGRPVGP